MDARELFIELGIYNDSPEKKKLCDYCIAIADYTNGSDYLNAYRTFKQLGSYMESEQWKESAADSLYDEAIKTFSKDSEAARSALMELDSEYRDVGEYQTFYQLYDELFGSEKYSTIDLSEAYLELSSLKNAQLRDALHASPHIGVLELLEGEWVSYGSNKKIDYELRITNGLFKNSGGRYSLYGLDYCGLSYSPYNDTYSVFGSKISAIKEDSFKIKYGTSDKLFTRKS